MTVISFPIKPHVTITRCLVFETRRETSAGTDVIRHWPPIHIFFLNYVDEDGFSCCVWDGQAYADALTAAHSWAVEGVALRDRTQQSRGRT